MLFTRIETAVAILMAIIFVSCSEGDLAEIEQPVIQHEAAADTGEWKHPTESFEGEVDDTRIIFMHRNFTAYRLSHGGMVTTGNLNTERGFDDDRDATVYVLDYDKPETNQKRFVRGTTGEFFMLDSSQKRVTGNFRPARN